MRTAIHAALVTLFATTAQADFPDTVRDHILPGYAAFATSAAALNDLAAQTCDVSAVQPAWHAAYDPWMTVQHVRFGPVETDGRGLSILFWPDPKALGTKAQMALLIGDPATLTLDAFAEQPVAARGLVALERLL